MYQVFDLLSAVDALALGYSMYVCTCVCIHIRVCHVYIVCHEYIDTCIHLFIFHLNIILLVVSDGDDSTKGWKSLFQIPGVIEVHELHEVFVQVC